MLLILSEESWKIENELHIVQCSDYFQRDTKDKFQNRTPRKEVQPFTIQKINEHFKSKLNQ